MTWVTESEEPVRQRMPLRRTSLSLLIGGAVALCLMITVQLLLLAGGEDVGPGRPGLLPAGEQVSVHTYPRLTPGNRANTPGCEVHGPDGERTYRWLGLLLFFPQFTLVWARLSNGRFLRR